MRLPPEETHLTRPPEETSPFSWMKEWPLLLRPSSRLQEVLLEPKDSASPPDKLPQGTPTYRRGSA